MRGISPMSRGIYIVIARHPLTLGCIILFVSTIAASSWTPMWLLAGFGFAVLTVWGLIWQAGSRQARVALASRTEVFRNSLPVGESSLLVAALAGGPGIPQECLVNDAHDESPVRQLEPSLRRAAVSRYASRRVLVRNPFPGPRRHHLRRWGHR